MGTLALVDVGHTDAHTGIKLYGSKSLDFAPCHLPDGHRLCVAIGDIPSEVSFKPMERTIVRTIYLRETFTAFKRNFSHLRETSTPFKRNFYKI